MMFTTKDPLGREVGLKRKTWEYKICNFYSTNGNGEHGNSHPEMAEYYDEIVSSIESPQYIIEDTRTIENEDGEEEVIVNEFRDEYLRFFFDSENNLGMIKTIVDFSQPKGDIVTTHKISGRIKGVKKGGRVKYDSTKK